MNGHAAWRLGRARVRVVLGDLWRTFFADPVRENMVRSHGGGITATSMISLGVVAFAIAAAGVVLAPQIAATPVGPDSAVLGSYTEPGSPVTIPVYFYPVFAIVLMLGTYLGLFGSAYATRGLATIAVGMILLPTTVLAGMAWRHRDETWWGYLALPTTLLLPLVVLLLRRTRPGPPVTQAVTCIATLLACVPAVVTLISSYMVPGITSGVSLMAQEAETVVVLLSSLVGPAALLAGTGAVSFGRTVTDFLARSIHTLAGRRVLPFLAAFAALLVWRSVATVVAVVQGGHVLQDVTKSLLLAALLAGACWWWSWATRGFDETADEVEAGSAGGATVLALLLLVSVLVSSVGLVVAYLEGAIFLSLHSAEPVEWASDLAGRPAVTIAWGIGVGIGLMVWAWHRSRRRPSIVAAWLGIGGAITALTITWNNVVFSPDWGALAREDYARAVVLVVVVASARELRRWRSTRTPPTPGWTMTAFSAIALTALVAQGSFLEDPFRPVLGFTAVGLVFFGVVWGFLTAGAHSKTTGLGGLGRSTVMLSYAVLSTAIVAWGASTGADPAGGLASTFGEAGRTILGGTLLVALLAVWIPILFGLAQPAVREEEPDVAVQHTGQEPETSDR